jgi:benzil reductase ((S)-benzoin forming)
MLTRVITEENHKNLTVFSIHPGIVDTNMQKKIRETKPDLFPLLSKFNDYYKNNELENIETVAKKLNYIIQNFAEFTKNTLSIRDVNIK